MQPLVNIGLVGHVDHGKTTLTYALSGIWTDTHSEEIKRGISIKLGYANATFRKCPLCKGYEAYTTNEICPHHNVKTEILREVSFVDAPGHEALMATVISGSSLMDGAILVIAANEPCPQPQTKEHLVALEIAGIKNIVIVQNKIDLVSKDQALKNYREIKEFIKNTIAKDSPIIPISAQHKVNIDALIYYIEKKIPTPKRDLTKPARMYVVRSFDVNKPGTKINDLVGGVIGGSLIQGKIKVGDEIEIRPGIRVERYGKSYYEPLFTEVTSIFTYKERLNEAIPGGLIALGTKLDPSLTKADGLSGSIVGKAGTLPENRYELSLDVKLMERIVGLKEEMKVEPLRVNEPIVIVAGTTSTVGIVTKAKKDYAEVRLKTPVCIESGARVVINRRIVNRWRLIGYGIVL